MAYRKNKVFDKKEVKFLPYKEKLYFTIIDSVMSDGKLPNLPITKQAKNHYISKLKRDGILIKLGYATWGVDKDKVDQFKFIEKVKKVKEVKTLSKGSQQHLTKYFTSLQDKRGHGFIISFKIPKITGWHKRKDFLDKNNIENIPVGIHKSGNRIIVRDHKTHLYKNTIVIYTPPHLSYFSGTAEDSYRYAIYDLHQILKQVEGIMGVSFKIDGTYKFKVSRQHYAKVESYLAKMYKRDNKRLYVANDKGVWLITDDSLGLNEEETINNKTAVKDMDKVLVPFYNSLKEQYEKTGESFQVDKLMQMQYTQFKTQQQMSRNIEDITEVLKKLLIKTDQ